MTRKEQIRSAYRLTGDHASFYDGMMTYSTFLGKAVCRIVWNMDGEKNLRYIERRLLPVDLRRAGRQGRRRKHPQDPKKPTRRNRRAEAQAEPERSSYTSRAQANSIPSE